MKALLALAIMLMAHNAHALELRWTVPAQEADTLTLCTPATKPAKVKQWKIYWLDYSTNSWRLILWQVARRAGSYDGKTASTGWRSGQEPDSAQFKMACADSTGKDLAGDLRGNWSCWSNVVTWRKR